MPFRVKPRTRLSFWRVSSPSAGDILGYVDGKQYEAGKKRFEKFIEKLLRCQCQPRRKCLHLRLDQSKRKRDNGLGFQNG